MSPELQLRLGFFLGTLAVMAFWEMAAPRRPLTTSKARRWGRNLGLVAFYTVLVRIIWPVQAVGVAVIAEKNGWGVFHAAAVATPVAAVLSVILLDLIIYLQHVMFHAVPAFWKLHMVHHADLDYDLTTGIRFHPIEIALSMILKFSAIVLIGAPPGAVIAFEVILNSMAMFNHGNVRLPKVLDSALRLLFVTPDMHRVHHSVTIRETNSNFGFNLSLWDRIMGTYIPQPAAGHEGMTIGLAEFRDDRQITFPRLLILPFLPAGTRYAIGGGARRLNE